MLHKIFLLAVLSTAILSISILEKRFVSHLPLTGTIKARLDQNHEPVANPGKMDVLGLESEFKDKQLVYILIGATLFLLLLSGVAVLLFRNYKTRQLLLVSHLKQRFLQALLNPHFIFNAQTSIQNFIRQDKKEESIDYMISFSKLMRTVLENSGKDYISIEEDGQFLANYLHLQQLFHRNNFTKSINVDKTLEADLMLIPPMLTQPFVENAVIHGVSNLRKGKIAIRYTRHNDHILIEISDNGPGMGKSNDMHSDVGLHSSMGMDIVEDRIENLMKFYRIKIGLRIDFTDTMAKSGTTVRLTIPAIYQ